MSSWIRTVAIATTIGTAGASGVFFTFSTFTMNGLRELPPSEGIRAMQAINRHAPSPLFGLLLIGTATGCVALAIAGARQLDTPVGRYQFLAAALYLIGVIVLTGAYHVPRNDHLAALDANSAEGLAYWPVYLREWRMWNHARTLAPLGSALLLAISIGREPNG